MPIILILSIILHIFALVDIKLIDPGLSISGDNLIEPYEGDTINNTNIYHGIGKYDPQDGSQYYGNWSYGQKHGYGTFTFHHKTNRTGIRDYSYKGYYSNNTMHGYGVYTSYNETYQGYWENDTRHGIGYSLWKSGTTYNGTWYRNFPNGTGKYTFANGDTYEGDVFMHKK